MRWVRNIRIGLLHATYHRNLKQAELAQQQRTIEAFRTYVYKAEDAWRKLVILQEKNKK
jgi:hypothetical protein